MNPTTSVENWSLEVVRGKDVGHRFALKTGSLVLGNALNGSPGLDLGTQEGNAPRKMAARQSQLDVGHDKIVIRDLDSPGGTFVNRQRVLAGQSRTLGDGDVIQLGGVQLRLVKSSPNGAKIPEPAAPLAFAFGSGTVCHSWDDFLVISAQKWAELRDELTSGRLAAYLHTIGRADMAPDPHQAGTPDERLDAWIGRLPTQRASAPELEVHPRTLSIAMNPGASTRRKIQISNTGFRLLKTTVRAETPTVPWLKIVSAGADPRIVTLDSSEVSIEVSAPEAFSKPLSTSLVFDGNGGKISVAIRMEPAAKLNEAPIATARPANFGLREWIARQSAVARILGCSVLALVFRVAIESLARIPQMLGLESSSDVRLGLLGPSLGFSILGGLVGLLLAARKGEARDVPSSAFTGAILGVLVAAIGVAFCRAGDSLRPAWLSGAFVARIAVTVLLGALVAAVSIVIVPPSPSRESST